MAISHLQKLGNGCKHVTERAWSKILRGHDSDTHVEIPTATIDGVQDRAVTAQGVASQGTASPPSRATSPVPESSISTSGAADPVDASKTEKTLGTAAALAYEEQEQEAHGRPHNPVVSLDVPSGSILHWDMISSTFVQNVKICGIVLQQLVFEFVKEDKVHEFEAVQFWLARDDKRREMVFVKVYIAKTPSKTLGEAGGTWEARHFYDDAVALRTMETKAGETSLRPLSVFSPAGSPLRLPASNRSPWINVSILTLGFARGRIVHEQDFETARGEEIYEALKDTIRMQLSKGYRPYSYDYHHLLWDEEAGKCVFWDLAELVHYKSSVDVDIIADMEARCWGLPSPTGVPDSHFVHS
ncbi:hypothetical protein CAC42_3644 [Sphaceloma murrayae]|uniref:Uncharacterized protein n=1 Tax=Sphaceloma murrayae TaxID=2082308 RepID=A0A2K1QPQ5_9PEZI|nr:hypothetical protein CAC42_3644 [Sphaceloma murrayae]